MGNIKLDIGCGKNKREGYIGIDKIAYEGVDCHWDVEWGLPFGDNSIEAIYASHFLEHTQHFIFIMEEFYRVLKPNGIAEIKVPHWAGHWAFTEHHVRFFNFFSFEEFANNHRYPISKARFKILVRRFNYHLDGIFGIVYTNMMNWLSNINSRYFEIGFAHLLPPNEIYFKLQAIK